MLETLSSCKGDRNMKKNSLLKVVIAAVLVIGAVVFVWNNNQTKAIGSIVIDVNPSLEMVVDNDYRVVDVIAKNEEAQDLLRGFDIDDDREIYEVAEDLTELLLKNGYLGLDVENHILISGDVDQAYINSTKAAMQSYLSERDVKASFLAAFLDDDDQDDNQASAGKVKLSKKIAELTGEMSVDELKNMTLGELFSLLEEYDVMDDDFDKDFVVVTTDPAPTNEHIGINKAEELAFAHLGINASDVYDKDYDDLDDGKYELKFKVNGVEYEVDVHSRTGAILKVEIDDKDDDDRKTGSNQQPATPSTPSTPTTPSNTRIGAEKAKQLALAHVGVSASQVRELEVEFDDGRYEVEFETSTTEYEIKVHATSGEILKVERDDNDDDDDRPVTQPSVIGVDRAKQLAFAHFGVSAGSVHDLEVELDDGKYEIEFEIGELEYEIEIHATSGKVLKSEIDD